MLRDGAKCSSVGPFGTTECREWSEKDAHVGFACMTGNS